MFATFAIFLREGIEASMIISVLLAYLKKSGEEDKIRYVIAGVIAALATAGVIGTVLYLTVHTYAGTRLQTIIETILFLIAIVVLTYMTFWMTAHAREIPSSLRARAESAMGENSRRERGALFFIAYQSVVREGMEAMVFTLALVFANGARSSVIGAAGGIGASLIFAYAVYHLGKRINMARAFRVLGVALMVFAAALVVDAVENLQALGWLPFLTHPLWNTTALLSENSNLGDVAHSLLGYAAQPTPLEVTAWLAYLSVAVVVFLTITRRRPARTRAQS
ncbi:MAG: FTR1 family iron permease [Acidimicrobiales bacterium]